jgi:hypothetical protein
MVYVVYKATTSRGAPLHGKLKQMGSSAEENSTPKELGFVDVHHCKVVPQFGIAKLVQTRWI